jgi:hypothetical protein
LGAVEEYTSAECEEDEDGIGGFGCVFDGGGEGLNAVSFGMLMIRVISLV